MDVNQLDPAWPISSQQPFSWIQTNTNMINRSMSNPMQPVPSTKKRKRSKEDSEDSDGFFLCIFSNVLYNRTYLFEC